MSTIKLYATGGGTVKQVLADPVDVERSLQAEIEAHLHDYLGVRLLASEYSTGRMHGGRIDSIGIDSENRPVIIEYKRSQNANVMNQALYYLGWLLEHKDEFHRLAASALQENGSGKTDWNGVRLVCIAADFNRHDVHAARLMGRKIELIRYRRYQNSLLLLEWIDEEWLVPLKARSNNRSNKDLPSFAEGLEMRPELSRLFDRLKDYTISLSNEVWIKQRKYGVDFRTGTGKDLTNFATVSVDRDAGLELWVGHDSVVIRQDEDLEMAKASILRAFRHSGPNETAL
jgi:hypothetical protein